MGSFFGKNSWPYPSWIVFPFLMIALLLTGSCLTGRPDRETKNPFATSDSTDYLALLGKPNGVNRFRVLFAQKPGEGLVRLLTAARAVGRANALEAAAYSRRCVFISLENSESALSRRPTSIPGLNAGNAAVAWMAEDPQLMGQALKSNDPFVRSMAILSQAHKADLLFAVLEKTAQDKDPLVAELSNQALQCCLSLDPRGVAGSQERLLRWVQMLKERSVSGPKRIECKEPGPEADTILRDVLSGKLKLGGASSSNKVINISLRGDDGTKVDMGAACSIHLYERVAEQGKYMPQLVEPVLAYGVPSPGRRLQAARILLRDLTKYPQEKRNEYLARAINAGQADSRSVRVRRRDTFAQNFLLEALGRQNTEAGRKIVERQILCRGTFGQSEKIALLGFVPTKESADLAFRIGKQCKEGTGEAAVALIRLEDPRAAEVLRRALRQAFLPDSLYQAIEEHPSDRILQVLENASPHEEENAQKLKDYLTQPG